MLCCGCAVVVLWLCCGAVVAALVYKFNNQNNGPPCLSICHQRAVHKKKKS